MSSQIQQALSACAALAITVTTAVANPTAGPLPSPDGSVVAAWAQVVPNPVGTGIAQPSIDLRFVIENSMLINEDTACAAFAIQGSVQGESLITPTPRANPKTTDTTTGSPSFPVTLCRATLLEHWTDASLIKTNGNTAVEIQYQGQATGKFVTVSGPAKIGRQYIDGAGNDELRIVTLGDTGCKGQDGQNCTVLTRDSLWPLNTKNWPFHLILDAATPTASPPDLAIHVGDYRYYYEPGSFPATPDSWAYWLLDFFNPARDGLLNAPWALSRGNHEICPFGNEEWYGVGYEYLMGTQPPATSGAPYCSGVSLEQTWSFDIAPGGIVNAQANDPHRMVMIDSSLDRSGHLQSRFERAIELSDVDSVWWVSHIPAVNLYSGHGGLGDKRVRAALEGALVSKGTAGQPLNLCAGSTCKPSALILGHDHLTQKIEFFKANHRGNGYLFPMTYIVGHSGVDLRSAGLNRTSSTCSFKQSGYPIQGVGPSDNPYTAQISWKAEFGYVAWTRSSTTAVGNTGWKDHPKGMTGDPMTFDAYDSTVKCMGH